MHRGENFPVALMQCAGRFPVKVPQPKNGDGAARRRFPCKGKAGGKIVGKRQIEDVRFKGVQGNADLIELCFSGQKRISAPGQQRSVRREHRTEAERRRVGEKARQKRMRGRFSHQMEIEIIRPRTQLFREQEKFRLRHGARRADGPGTERTGEIADIRDLKKGFSVVRHGEKGSFPQFSIVYH